MSADPRVCHLLQSRSNSCVPACVSIIRCHRGAPIAEAAVSQGWAGSRRGYALEDAADFLGDQVMGRYDADNVAWLEVQLMIDWVIAQVFSSAMAKIAARATPPLLSPHGSLPEDYGLLHTIVLTGAEGDRFEYLDPYFPVARQPLAMTREQFAEAWTGRVVLPS